MMKTILILIPVCILLWLIRFIVAGSGSRQDKKPVSEQDAEDLSDLVTPCSHLYREDKHRTKVTPADNIGKDMENAPTFAPQDRKIPFQMSDAEIDKTFEKRTGEEDGSGQDIDDEQDDEADDEAINEELETAELNAMLSHADMIDGAVDHEEVQEVRLAAAHPDVISRGTADKLLHTMEKLRGTDAFQQIVSDKDAYELMVFTKVQRRREHLETESPNQAEEVEVDSGYTRYDTGRFLRRQVKA